MPDFNIIVLFCFMFIVVHKVVTVQTHVRTLTTERTHVHRVPTEQTCSHSSNCADTCLCISYDVDIMFHEHTASSPRGCTYHGIVFIIFANIKKRNIITCLSIEPCSARVKDTCPI